MRRITAAAAMPAEAALAATVACHDTMSLRGDLTARESGAVTRGTVGSTELRLGPPNRPLLPSEATAQARESSGSDGSGP